MELDFLHILTENLSLVVIIGCLCLGYILKTSFKFISNDYIPCILAVVGMVINCVVNGVSVDTVVYGTFTGLAATGLHQAFTRFVEHNQSKDE